LRDRQAF